MAKSAKLDRKISKSLQETVAENPHIDLIHFDANGNHHFNVHDHIENVKGKNENNGKYARIHVTSFVDNKLGVLKKVSTPIMNTKIVETLTREDVLNAEAESDLNLLGLTGLTEAEKKAIAKMRKGE